MYTIAVREKGTTHLRDTGVHVHLTTSGENRVFSLSLPPSSSSSSTAALRGPPQTTSHSSSRETHGQRGRDNRERDKSTSNPRQRLRERGLYGVRGNEGAFLVPRAVLVRKLFQDCVYGRMESELQLE